MNRMKLTEDQSKRWQSGDPDALDIEMAMKRRAEDEGLIGTVVVALADGRTAFAFRVGGEA
jgi:hypothetical protein